MANQLASPTFKTGPSDKLAAVDVYKVQQQTGQVVNSVKNILQKYNPTLARSLAGFSSFDVQSLTRVALNLGNVNAKNSNLGMQLLARAQQISPGIAGTIRSMDAAIRDKITGTMAGIGSGYKDLIGKAKGGLIEAGMEKIGTGSFNMSDPNNFQCSIGDFDNAINIGNLDRAKALSSVVNGLTGQDSIKFNDLGGQVALHSSIIKECFDCEISGVTKDIFAVIGDRQVMSIVARETMPDVLKYSSIDDLYNISSNLYEGELLAATPNLLNTFTRVFGNDKKSKYHNLGATGQKHITTYAELIQAYDTAYPDWNKYVRATDDGDEIAINISPLVGGTPTFNGILVAGATNAESLLEKPYLAAPLMKTDGVEQMLLKQYPKTKFYFNTQVNKVVDPRALARA